MTAETRISAEAYGMVLRELIKKNDWGRFAECIEEMEPGALKTEFLQIWYSNTLERRPHLNYLEKIAAMMEIQIPDKDLTHLLNYILRKKKLLYQESMIEIINKMEDTTLKIKYMNSILKKCLKYCKNQECSRIGAINFFGNNYSSRDLVIKTVANEVIYQGILTNFMTELFNLDELYALNEILEKMPENELKHNFEKRNMEHYIKKCDFGKFTSLIKKFNRKLSRDEIIKIFDCHIKDCNNFDYLFKLISEFESIRDRLKYYQILYDRTIEDDHIGLSVLVAEKILQTIKETIRDPSF